MFTMFSGRKYNRVGDSTTLEAQNSSLTYQTAELFSQNAVSTSADDSATFTSAVTGELPVTGETQIIKAAKPVRNKKVIDLENSLGMFLCVQEWWLAWSEREMHAGGISKSQSEGHLGYFMDLTKMLLGPIEDHFSGEEVEG